MENHKNHKTGKKVGVNKAKTPGTAHGRLVTPFCTVDMKLGRGNAEETTTAVKNTRNIHELKDRISDSIMKVQASENTDFTLPTGNAGSHLDYITILKESEDSEALRVSNCVPLPEVPAFTRITKSSMELSKRNEGISKHNTVHDRIRKIESEIACVPTGDSFHKPRTKVRPSQSGISGLPNQLSSFVTQTASQTVILASGIGSLLKDKFKGSSKTLRNQFADPQSLLGKSAKTLKQSASVTGNYIRKKAASVIDSLNTVLDDRKDRILGKIDEQEEKLTEHRRLTPAQAQKNSGYSRDFPGVENSITVNNSNHGPLNAKKGSIFSLNQVKPLPEREQSLSNDSHVPKPLSPEDIFPQKCDETNAAGHDRCDSPAKAKKQKPKTPKHNKICSHLAACSCVNTRSVINDVDGSWSPNDPFESVFNPLMVDLMSLHQQLAHATQLGREGLEKEYQQIKAIQETGTFHAARKTFNSHKNRYSDTLCFDHTRVVLEPASPPGNDYINASHVNGYEHRDCYICSQGPLGSTTNDFWRMIWQQNVRVIVMTTKLKENGRVKCSEYWPTQEHASSTYGSFFVYNFNVLLTEDYVVSSLFIKNSQTLEERLVRHFLFLKWPDYGTPPSPESFLNFLFAIRYAQRGELKNVKDWQGHPRGPPLVVHCSAGVGRTGTFICVDICIYMMDAIQRVNVKSVVKLIRAQRAFAVQMPEQYVFCHRAVLQYALDMGLLPADNDLSPLK